MKKILVPTDFSEHALMASKVAAQLAKKTNAQIIFLHIVDLPVYEGDMPFHEYQNIAESLFVLKATKKNFKELFQQPFLKGVKYAEAVQYNNVYDSIAEQAEKHKVDLIIMGSHGTKGVIDDLFIGSNTEKVVRLSKIPVLTVKNPHENFNPQNIVFASNFFGEVEPAFQPILEFAKLFNSTIHLLKVVTRINFETTSTSLKIMHDFAKKFELQNFTINTYNEEDLESGILNFCKTHTCDMVAIATHGRRGIAHLVNGSIAEDVVNHVHVPILSTRIPDGTMNTNPNWKII